ncbi:uncharacterized protein E0L32_006096 [Thyridium curvatum]|uniref:Uncharacterized protein n=1 Tax=Thyridium curvatum TaxID=1093900 RepID=A0A507B2R5_9PEZI|nr:uncharacterized protein E0L32_006096 [Thyridium curvatum]TPX13366.1 hypothetical protein E0L32_006096 [Thyridium curvatum]
MSGVSLVTHLWIAGTPIETHVSPLHHQTIRGRKFQITEEPGLHLISYYDRIFIKPIPPYLFCREFWDFIREEDSQVYQAAAGFMRTYCYLIRYEVDFSKATSPEMALIPFVDGQALSFDSFVHFISQFNSLNNYQVSPRFSYGTLRLTRLNYMAPFLMNKLAYLHVQSQWTDYISSFITPMITVFGVTSLVLNLIQVGLAAESLEPSWPDAGFL